MPEKQIRIDTADGPMELFVVKPENEGPFGAVIEFPDAGGLREELKGMARRYCAEANVAVAMPDLYHRFGEGITFEADEVFGPGGDEKRAEMFGLLGRLKDDEMVADGRATLDHLHGEAGVAEHGRGCVGYCLGGRAVTRALAAFPDELKVGSALHPSQMYTDASDSPHLDIARFAKDSEVYYGFGGDDELTPPPAIAAIREQLETAGIAHHTDVTPGAQHGFALKSFHYHPEADRLHWEHTLRLFAKLSA